MAGTEAELVNHGLERQTLTSKVYDYLRKRIIDFSLKPGDKIDVSQLSQGLAVSPTPIREALHKLAEQGLVEQRPYVGYFVTKLTPRDIQELFDLRKSLETLALKYVYKNGADKKVKELMVKLNELKQHEFPIEETQKFDEDFHLGFLIKGSGNRWLEKFANGVIDLIKLTTRLSINPVAAWEEHLRILEALSKHNLKKAIFALENHLERAKKDSAKADDNIKKNHALRGVK